VTTLYEQGAILKLVSPKQPPLLIHKYKVDKMVTEIKIENLPEEIGEETTIANRDDGTISSKVLGSTDGKNVLRATESINETKKTEVSSDEEEVKANTETEEREFDKNPTVLYALVQKKLWKEAIARAKSHPREARAFICRREKEGRVRWRLLPLHAAIVFKAPEEVIRTILGAFPEGSEEKDDQGMLPLHLAFRNSATEEVVHLLLLAFPQSINSPDRKGRIPLTLAKTAAPPNREIYVKALEKGPAHYAMGALARSRERIEEEQKVIFETKLAQVRQFQEYALCEMKAEMEANAEKKIQELSEIVAEKEEELTKIHENSQVLVDHVTSLEAQMNTRSDTERFLATKIAKLEQRIKQEEIDKEERDAFWKSTVSDKEGVLLQTQTLKAEGERVFDEERAKFNAGKDSIMADYRQCQKDLASTRDELAQTIAAIKEKEEDWIAKDKKKKEKSKQIEVEWASTQANCAILDSQLKKRIENEHLLASQVSTLARRLAESADNAMRFTKEIKNLENEKFELEESVKNLVQRLKKTTAVLEDTRKHQMIILDDAIVQEEMMAKSMETHAKTVSECLTDERELEATKAEMMAIIEQKFYALGEKRHRRLSTATEQGQYLTNMNNSRRHQMSSVQVVTSNVVDCITRELNLDTVAAEVEVKSKGSSEQKSDDTVEICDQEETEAEENDFVKDATEVVKETIEVVVSAKKSIPTVSDVDAEDAQKEETRTDMDEVRPEETMNVSRVTAE